VLQARAAAGGPILGICGGYQLLGEQIEDDIESRRGGVKGLGLAFALKAFGVAANAGDDFERSAAGARGVVLVGDGRTEDHEDRVPDELLDGPVVRDGLLSEVLEDPGDELLEDLGVELLRQGREPDEVREQHRD